MDEKQKELKSRLDDLKKYQQEQEEILQVSRNLRKTRCQEKSTKQQMISQISVKTNGSTRASH
jgi:hypothetical protein